MSRYDLSLLPKRFQKKIKVNPGQMIYGEPCWEWTGSIDKGYGRVWCGKEHPSRSGLLCGAHRWVFEFFEGLVPLGHDIDHHCENKVCVNPAHLEPVLHWVNSARSPNTVASINSTKTHCPQGHELSLENNCSSPSEFGLRRCCICRRGQDKDRQYKRYWDDPEAARERQREKRLRKVHHAA